MGAVRVPANSDKNGWKRADEVEKITVEIPVTAETVDMLLNGLKYDGHWEEKYGWIGLLEESNPDRPQDVIGATTEIFPGLVIEVVDVDFGTTNSPDWDSRFHQGYEYEGFIIVRVGTRFFKKEILQDSYGTLESRDEPCVEVRQTKKTVEVYSYE